MKRFLIAAALAATTAPALAANVGESVNVGQPGFYGRIAIGNFPQPQLIYPQPVIIQQIPVEVAPQPIYLHVPPGQAKDWRKHCRKYNACGQPVYFVQDNWYNDVYAPRYREQDRRGGEHEDHGEGRDKDHGEGHDKNHGKGKGKGHKED